MSRYSDHLEELDRRWSEALAASRIDAAIIAAGVSRPYFLDDQSPPYRANPHFAQWLPAFECPQSLLIITPGRKPGLYFYQPEDYWHLPPVEPDVGDGFVLHTFTSLDALTEAAARAVERHNRTAFIGEPDATGMNLPVSDVNPPLLLNHLHFERARKTAFEVDCMRAATRKGVRGHRAAAAAFTEGASELEIHHCYLAASAQTEAELPYPSIVALNQHAGVLHYQHYDRQGPARRHSFLIDAGARHHGYACDITRTYAAVGCADFAALVDALDSRQRALIDTIRVGQSFLELHESMHRSLAEILAAQDLVHCSADAAFEGRITDAFFPHGLGHLIGLQTHDVAGHMVSADGGTRPPPARYPALRLTRPIADGQVFTIEPGLYFIPMLLDALRARAEGRFVNWAKVEMLMPCGGIRIEDNVHVRSDGVENLTRDAFAADAR